MVRVKRDKAADRLFRSWTRLGTRPRNGLVLMAGHVETPCYPLHFACLLHAATRWDSVSMSFS